MFPKHHKPPDDPAIAHVCDCILACQLSSRSQKSFTRTFRTQRHNSAHSSPRQIIHSSKRSNKIFKHRTHANQTHHHNTPSKGDHCAQDQQSRSTINNVPAFESSNKRRQTARARTHPAVTITTPELSPCTAATGVRLSLPFPSPSCTSHKASHAHHAAAINMCRIPTTPQPVRPRTRPL